MLSHSLRCRQSLTSHPKSLLVPIHAICMYRHLWIRLRPRVISPGQTPTQDPDQLVQGDPLGRPGPKHSCVLHNLESRQSPPQMYKCETCFGSSGQVMHSCGKVPQENRQTGQHLRPNMHYNRLAL